jgi:hypothetical protein
MYINVQNCMFMNRTSIGRGKIDTPNTQIQERSHSWFGTGATI